MIRPSWTAVAGAAVISIAAVTGIRAAGSEVSIVDAPLGKGRVVLFGNEVNWRAQPHGTFKLLFNGIYYGSATAASASSRTTDQP